MTRRAPRPPDLAQLVATLRARGVRLRPEGATLWIHGASRLTRSETALLRRHKADVLAVLRPAPRPGPGAWLNAPWRWPLALPGLGPHTVGPEAPCADCAAAGGTVRQEFAPLSLPGPAAVAWTVRVVAGTWARYGMHPLCLAHAQARARTVGLPPPVYADPARRAAWAAAWGHDGVTRARRVFDGVITDVRPVDAAPTPAAPR